MKKQKLKRRTYRPASKKVKTVKKVLWRILFVLICAAALCVFSVYLGSWLMERAAQIDGILTTDGEQTEAFTNQTLPPAPDDGPEESLDVTAAYLDVLAMTVEEIEEYVYGLHEDYNTVSINISSDDGRLIYVSPALLEYVKLDPSDINVTPNGGADTNEGNAPSAYGSDVLSKIKTALAAVKRKELRACAVYSPSSAVLQTENYEGAWEIDAVIVSELYELGFDEVILDSLFAEQAFDAESISRTVAYVSDLKKKAEGVRIGITVPEETLFVPSNAGMMNTLTEYTDFLCIHVMGEGDDADEAYSIAYEEFHSVKGALNAYNVRAVIFNEDETTAAAVAAALRDLASVSVQFTREVPSPEYSVISEEGTTETEAVDTAYNENANRKDSYTNDTNYEEPTDNEG